MINDKYYRRKYVIAGIAVCIVLTYVGILFNLQVLDDSYKQKAASNALIRQTIYPYRGLIFDRNDSLLVYNQPLYEIALVMKEMPKDFDTLGFCRVLDIDREQFDQRMIAIKDTRKNPGYSSYTPQVFSNQLNKEDIAKLQEELFLFPGVYIRNRAVRSYSCNCAAQILGSIGEVNGDDIQRDNYYVPGDYAGRDGIEKTYEYALRGEKGTILMMRDSRGRIKGHYKNGADDQKAIPGQDIHLTIDIQLQKAAEQLLQGKIGSVVAIEPATGEVLVLASSPTWNPNIMVGKERSKSYMMLLNDPKKPLLNRATQATYSPGSTFKTLQSIVCLKEQVITPNTLYPCNGPGSTPIKCTHHHGSPVRLENALEQSCNPYFWYAFRDFLQKDGYGPKNERFRKRYALWRKDIMEFGLGQCFGDADIWPQSAGNIPSLEFYDRAYRGATGWKALTIRSLSIGQGEILVTPLQLANQTATIANKGYYITPHLNRNDSMLTRRHQTTADRSYFDIVQQGMRRVMTNGTGRHYAIDSLQMCGKTGTVQNGRGKDHAIFIGFAPMDHPKIAVAVVVENAGFGATWAAPIASLIMEQYLNDTIARTEIWERITTSSTIHDKKQ